MQTRKPTTNPRKRTDEEKQRERHKSSHAFFSSSSSSFDVSAFFLFFFSRFFLLLFPSPLFSSPCSLFPVRSISLFSPLPLTHRSVLPFAQPRPARPRPSAGVSSPCSQREKGAAVALPFGSLPERPYLRRRLFAPTRNVFARFRAPTRRPFVEARSPASLFSPTLHCRGGGALWCPYPPPPTAATERDAGTRKGAEDDVIRWSLVCRGG